MPRSMKIVINGWFWNSPTTGSGQYTHHLVKALSTLDADLQIILIIPTDKEQDARGKTQETTIPASCILHPVPCSRSNLGKVWFEQVLFPRACRRLDADLAHVPYWAPPIRPSVPTIVTIHDLIPLLLRDYQGSPLVRFYTALVSRTAQNAALTLTDSKASRRDIIAHLGLPDEYVRVIYLATDEGYALAPAPDDATVRARYGLPEQYVLYLGGFDVRKNIATVLRTYRWAGPLIGGECPLVIAGKLPGQDSAFAPNPRRLAQEQAVEQFVHFTGFVDEADKPAIYRGATAFIFPSRYEGFGLPPLEALACGTPVVGSDVSSIPEVVGNAGVLLPPDDAEGMADALVQLSTDKEFHAELSRRAVAQAARFSWERTARKTLAAYRDVLEINNDSQDI
ncbi:MAG: glycosyltransferase family 4 protein [Chloroflexi bacterium]|nr:glycosyltransferase family 4 protein [Chloroflexota bacterium]